MSASVRETALAALFDQLQAGLAGVTVLRNSETPEVIPDGGIAIQRDGDPGEPVEIELSPVAYSYEHPVEIEALVKGADAHRRAEDFDSLLRTIQAVVAADRTLGGAVAYAEFQAPEGVEEGFEGDVGVKGAALVLTLAYTTSDPLT